MKTLADLKRNLTVGRTLVMERHDSPTCPLIGLERVIVAADTTGCYISLPDEMFPGVMNTGPSLANPQQQRRKRSFLGFPKAKDVRFGEDGRTFQIFDDCYDVAAGKTVYRECMAYRFTN